MLEPNEPPVDQPPLFGGYEPVVEEPALVVNVHFEDIDGLREFARISGLQVHENTRTVWYE